MIFEYQWQRARYDLSFSLFSKIRRLSCDNGFRPRIMN